METIVVTAATPMTIPSTVSPARILFLPSARSATRMVRSRFTSVLLLLQPGDQLLTFLKVAGHQLRELVVVQTGGDFDCLLALPFSSSSVPSRISWSSSRTCSFFG